MQTQNSIKPLGALFLENIKIGKNAGHYDEDRECWVLPDGRAAIEAPEMLMSGSTGTYGADEDWVR